MKHAVMKEYLTIAQHAYKRMDSFDLNAFLEYCAEDMEFVLGNNKPIQGKLDVQKMFDFSLIKNISHTIVRDWSKESTLVLEFDVSYIRKDSKSFALPAVVILVFTDKKITKVQVFNDMNPLFN
jgi:ketosteroid isomerase-like protein